MRIDAHQHFWDLAGPFRHGWLESPEHAAIRRSFLPADLAPLVAQHGLDGTIFVQTQHDPAEHEWVLGLADAHPWILGVVGWVDLAAPDVADRLAAARRHPKFAGLRHLLQDDADAGWLSRHDVRRGFRALAASGATFDLLIRPRHLPAVPELADAFPSLRFVIDHAAKPDLRTGSLTEWLDPLRAAGRRPNVWCKLSGLVTEADRAAWTPEQLAPCVQAVVRAFGPRRTLWGSDWPVCLLAADYGRWMDTADLLLKECSASDRAWIFGDAAAECYRLPPPIATPKSRPSQRSVSGQ